MWDLQTWQDRTLAYLSQLFEKDMTARAFILTGSLADDDVQEDVWSDIDVKIVLADHTVDNYFTSIDWLCDFGQVIGVERHEGLFSKTLRVCLEGFRRFDFVFVPESCLQNSSAWESGLFQRPYIVLWSRLPNLETRIAAHAGVPTYQAISGADLIRLVDHFWFKAYAAVGKIVRDDLLIGLHLALDLARDCLVLQMIRRDQEKKSNIHRTGGWGNTLVERFSYESSDCTAEAILDLVTRSCGIFDELAISVLPGYEPRRAFLLPSIEAAKHRHSPHSPSKVYEA